MEEEISIWTNINQFIETPLTQDLLIPFLQYLIIPLIILWITYIVVQKGIESYKHKNTKELKIDDYYNEVSKEVLINLVKDWTDLFQQTEIKMHLMSKKVEKELPSTLLLKNGDQKKKVELNDGTTINKIPPFVYAVGNLIMTTWIYGKSNTNKLLAAYQQHNFLDQSNYTDSMSEDHNTKSIVYMAMIIVSLRKDLMNFDSDPMALIKLKISDVSKPENEQRFLNYLDEVKKEIES